MLFGVLGFFHYSKPNFKTAPNVIFILADDLNDKVGFLDEPYKAYTPHLNALASLSTNFKDAHAPATICNPSRLAILSSRQPFNTGVYELYPAQASQQAIQKLKLPVLMDTFRKNNYLTVGTGKIFHWGNNSIKYFDEFYETKSADDTQDDRINPNWRMWNKSEDALSDARKTQWAKNFLGLKHKKPFFMMIGYESPHLPWIVPPKYHELNTSELNIDFKSNCNDLIDLDPKISLSYILHIQDMQNKIYEQKAEQGIRAYLSSISFLDAQIGSLIESLKINKLMNNTIIVFSSDHGFHLSEKCLMRKKTLWKESSHVPLLIYVPGFKGKSFLKPVSLLDIYPTLVEICKLKEKNSFDGRSLKTAILFPYFYKDDSIITTQGFNNHAIRSNKWTYIRYYSGAEELYKRDIDPLEKNNLAQDPQFQKIKEKFARKISKLKNHNT
ncbi:MAG: hypothetical protein RLZZ361_459 [Cyanobacteriota bacterium]|jgi:arylsulfatase A-like enzyme